MSATLFPPDHGELQPIGTAAARMRDALAKSAGQPTDAPPSLAPTQPTDCDATVEPEPAPTDVPVENVTPDAPSCARCGQPFTPRSGTGGKPQRYCSTECRKAANATNSPNVPTSGPTSKPTPEDNQALVDKAMAAARATVAAYTPPAPDFDWGSNGGDADSVVLWDQPATAVYWNPRGQVVIRQEAHWNDDDDTCLIFDPGNLPRLIERLEQVLREAYDKPPR